MTDLPAVRIDNALRCGSDDLLEVEVLVVASAAESGVWGLTLLVGRGSAVVFSWVVELFLVEVTEAVAGISGISGSLLVRLVVAGTGSDFLRGGDTGSASTKS